MSADPLDLAAIRQDYARQELHEERCPASPVDLLHTWLQEAVLAKVLEPTAMNLATVSSDGRPSARMVLCKGVENGQIVFYSSYASRKGQQLASNPHAALTFFWPELERQVRLEGTVQPLDAAQSDAYFASRPYASRIGAWASLQSQPLSSKAELLLQASKWGLRYPFTVPRPAHWGGYALTPVLIEFWQGRPSRLHDRILYQHNTAEGWRTSRLYP